jgi:hypothetical protein
MFTSGADHVCTKQITEGRIGMEVGFSLVLRARV